MRRLSLIAVLAAVVVVSCAPAPTPAPSAEPELRRKASGPGPSVTARPDGSVPNAMEWKRNLPDRITATIKENANTSEQGTVKEIELTYSPNPPDVSVELAAAPGTPSFEIASVELTWTFNVPGEETARKIGPEKLPIAPVKVNGAPSDQPGLAFKVSIPLSILTLKPYFAAEDKAKRISRADAVLRFVDDKGRGILGRNTLVDLKVPVPVILL